MGIEENIYNEALAAIQADDLARARDLLTRLIKRNPRNADYWLWMSSVVDSLRERKYCLRQAYKINPEHEEVKQGLIILGELPLDEKLIVRPDKLYQDWQKDLRKDYLARFRPPSVKDFFTPKRLLIGFGAAALVLALVAIGIFAPSLRFTQRATPTRIVMATFRPPAALAQTMQVTPTEPLLTPTESGPTPLWMLLDETLTPTPRYVNTPHPRAEAFKTGMRALENEEWDEVITYMEQAADVEPDAPDIYYYIGEAYRNKEYDLPAIKAYNQALTRDGNFAPAYLGLGKTYLYEMDQWENARDNFELAIKNDPQILEAYLDLILIYLNQENSKNALLILDKADEAGLESPFLPLYRAQALLLIDEPEKALENALLANEMDPTHLQSYRVLAQSYLAAGEISEALDILTIYLAHEKYDGEAFTWLGLSHEARGEQSLAFDAYSRAIKLDNKQSVAYLQRGLIYFEREEYEQAKSDLVRTLDLDKHSFILNMTLGRTYLILEDYGNAYQKLSECEAYAEGDEDWAQIYFWRAQALEGLDGQAIAARKNWSNLLKLPEDTYPEEWKKIAEEHLGRVATFTRTPTLPRTVTPTRTPTPKQTATPKP